MELLSLLLLIAGLVALALWLRGRNSTEMITSDVHGASVEELQETPTEEGISRTVLWLTFFAGEACWSAPDDADIIGPIACTDPRAAFTVTSTASSDMNCPMDSVGSVAADNGRVACLRELP